MRLHMDSQNIAGIWYCILKPTTCTGCCCSVPGHEPWTWWGSQVESLHQYHRCQRRWRHAGRLKPSRWRQQSQGRRMRSSFVFSNEVIVRQLIADSTLFTAYAGRLLKSISLHQRRRSIASGRWWRKKDLGWGKITRPQTLGWWLGYSTHKMLGPRFSLLLNTQTDWAKIMVW